MAKDWDIATVRLADERDLTRVRLPVDGPQSFMGFKWRLDPAMPRDRFAVEYTGWDGQEHRVVVLFDPDA
jgi:hypothetical protein